MTANRLFVAKNGDEDVSEDKIKVDMDEDADSGELQDETADEGLWGAGPCGFLVGLHAQQHARC